MEHWFLSRQSSVVGETHADPGLPRAPGSIGGREWALFFFFLLTFPSLGDFNECSQLLRAVFFVGGGSFSPMIGWRQLGAFVQRYQRHKNLTAFMSPTQQEIAAWPTLHTNHSRSQMHTLQHTLTHLCRIQCSIHQIGKLFT